MQPRYINVSVPRFLFGPASRVDVRHWQSGAPRDLRDLPAAGFHAVVLCCMPGEYAAHGIREDLVVPGLLVLRVPMDDAEIDNYIVRTAQRAADWVVQVLRTGRRVLVSCRAGRNRSGLVSALAIMGRRGFGRGCRGSSSGDEGGRAHQRELRGVCAVEVQVSAHRYGRDMVPIRAAGVLLRADDTGRVLLGRRSALVGEPGVWSFFGGHVESGESAREAAVRELAEEAGIAATVSPDPVWVYPCASGPGSYATFFGRVEAEVRPEINWEHDAAGWFDPRRLPAPLHPGIGRLLDGGRS